ncbi:MAG: pantoate--beta-alanine ligase [Candidatus Coatesbacteria bacterium]|nr:pantoate--beta-alanine ligase [Candidatus Coatesbacteria bacterium]
MKIIREINEIRRICRDKKSLGFVPTMGALHKGHLSLVETLQKDCYPIVMSIFVNPKQFGKNEDFAKYPRDLEIDIKLAEEAKVDMLFIPSEEDLYPDDYRTYIDVEELSDKLCGKSRKGHFKGVTTIVLKLFNLIKPKVAAFGWKDAQQGIILKQMVKDLNLDVEIRMCDILRDSDGLALSSRNNYLSNEERKNALSISQALQLSSKMFASGVRDFSVIKKKLVEHFNSFSNTNIEYIEAFRIENLQETDFLEKGVIIAIAAKVGKTRLIDNWRIGE